MQPQGVDRVPGIAGLNCRDYGTALVVSTSSRKTRRTTRRPGTKYTRPPEAAVAVS
ncbi:hypothetical protein SSCG_04400 [Streptomyces clavuligerus]|nr:hypothetical protein SSCG_04400 [Streptomyces clavuligerus]